MPTIEAAAAGIATAAIGAGRTVLMGISAASMHNVIPRALGIAIVAVPDDRRDMTLRDRDGTALGYEPFPASATGTTN